MQSIGRTERTLATLFLVIGAAAVLGAIIVKFTGIPTGMLGPWAGAATVVLSTSVVFLQLRSSSGTSRALFALASLSVLGFVAELSGLLYATFGRYRYTQIWWPSIPFGRGQLFPFFVPFTWFLLITVCFLAVPPNLPHWKRVIFSAGLCTIVDFCMEPVLAGPVRLWIWADPVPIMVAPVQNAIGWAVVSLLGASILSALDLKASNGALPRALLIAILVFSVLIGLLFSRLGALTAVPVIAFLVLVQLKSRAMVNGAEAAVGEPEWT